MKKKLLILPAIAILLVAGAITSLSGNQELPVADTADEQISRTETLQAETDFDNQETDTGEAAKPKISEEKIYGYESFAASWAFDPTDIEYLLGHERTSVVKVKVLSVGEEASYLSSDEPKPHTPVTVEVLEGLYGEPPGGLITVYIQGGKVLIKDVIEHDNPTSVEKRGLNNLDESVKNSMYISYTSEYDYDVVENREYVLIINRRDDGRYVLVCYGYGIFEVPHSKARSAKDEVLDLADYKNVLTGNSLEIA